MQVDLLELVCLRLLGAHNHEPDSAWDTKRVLRWRHDELLDIYVDRLLDQRKVAQERTAT